MSPAPSPSPASFNATTQFVKLVAEAIPALRGANDTRGYALDFGVDEKALDAYATGALSVSERNSIQQVIVQCGWARAYVVEKIKSRRS